MRELEQWIKSRKKGGKSEGEFAQEKEGIGNGEQTYLINSLKGSNRPNDLATIDIVVLSPPGMIRASHFASSTAVRTWIKLNSTLKSLLEDSNWGAARLRRERCSATPPWRAKTPTVIFVVAVILLCSISLSLWPSGDHV